jgi:hypothetical protein
MNFIISTMPFSSVLDSHLNEITFPPKSNADKNVEIKYCQQKTKCKSQTVDTEPKD